MFVVLINPLTAVLAAALRDPVALHLAEVPGLESDARRWQHHAAESPQGALCREVVAAGCMALQGRHGTAFGPRRFWCGGFWSGWTHRDAAPLAPQPGQNLRGTAGAATELAARRRRVALPPLMLQRLLWVRTRTRTSLLQAAEPEPSH